MEAARPRGRSLGARKSVTEGGRSVHRSMVARRESARQLTTTKGTVSGDALFTAIFCVGGRESTRPPRQTTRPKLAINSAADVGRGDCSGYVLEVEYRGVQLKFTQEICILYAV